MLPSRISSLLVVVVVNVVVLFMLPNNDWIAGFRSNADKI